MSERPASLRVAAIGDVHIHQNSNDSLQVIFEKLSQDATCWRSAAISRISDCPRKPSVWSICFERAACLWSPSWVITTIRAGMPKK